MPSNPADFRSSSIPHWLRLWWKPRGPLRSRKDRIDQFPLCSAHVLCLESRVLLAGPTVTLSTAALAATATTLVINGTGFSTTVTNNSVLLADSVTGKSVTVIASVATTTSITIPISGMGTLTGGDPLTAVVTANGVSSGAAVQVATISPVVTKSTASVSSTTLSIKGIGFDATAAHNSVVVKDTVTGNSVTVTPTTASATSLTVSLSGLGTLTGGDILTAVVTTNSSSSGAAVQVGTIAPVVTPSTSPLTSTTLIIQGTGFDTTIAHNSVTFTNAGRNFAGKITAATATSLTATVSGALNAGILYAVVTVNSVKSGTAVEVAEIQPTVTKNTAKLAANATKIVITGIGFDPNHAQNTVVFNNGAAGIVTSCTATSLTVTFTVKPKTAGPLTVIVTTRHVSSGAAVQVATV